MRCIIDSYSYSSFNRKSSRFFFPENTLYTLSKSKTWNFWYDVGFHQSSLIFRYGSLNLIWQILSLITLSRNNLYKCLNFVNFVLHATLLFRFGVFSLLISSLFLNYDDTWYTCLVFPVQKEINEERLHGKHGRHEHQLVVDDDAAAQRLSLILEDYLLQVIMDLL